MHFVSLNIRVDGLIFLFIYVETFDMFVWNLINNCRFDGLYN